MVRKDAHIDDGLADDFGNAFRGVVEFQFDGYVFEVGYFDFLGSFPATALVAPG